MHTYIIDTHIYIKVIFNLYAKKQPFLTPPPPHSPASPSVFITVYCLDSRVRYFAESPGLPSEVFNCPSTSRGENAVLHQEQQSPSFPSNYRGKVHVVGKPERITVLQAEQEDGLKTGYVGKGFWRWTELGFYKYSMHEGVLKWF